MTHSLAAALCLTLSTAASANPLGSESYLGEDGLTAISHDGSNSVAFAQLPDDQEPEPGKPARKANSHFLGRYKQGDVWGVANFLMDWRTNHLEYKSWALAPGTAIAFGNVVNTGYDPTVAVFDGEIWAAFECGGEGFYGTSACIGPYDPSSGTIDATRTSVPLSGAAYDVGDPYSYSASVPKLLAFGGKLYVYWTSVKQLNAGDVWANLTSRGAELVKDSSGLLWIAGTSGTTSAVDPEHTVEVWGLGSDDRSNLTADMQGVFTDGQHVFATAGLGGNADGLACLTPLVGNDGCYRLAISRSFSPLGPGIFQFGDRLEDDQLISNSQNYMRLFVRPDGSRNLMAAMYQTYKGEAHPVDSGFWSYDIPADATYFQQADAPQGTRRISVAFDALEGMDASCSASNALTQGCDTAASRLCQQTYGYEAGFGPVQLGAHKADIVCVGSDIAKRKTKKYTALAGYQSACTGGSVAGSIFCHAAVDQLCQKDGFESGLSIEESSATEATFACVRAKSSARYDETWTALARLYKSCTLGNTDEGFICLPAADDECRKKGYVSGFGVNEMSQTDGQIVCLDK